MEKNLANTAAERIRDVCRYVEEHHDEPLTIAQLASLAAMSRFHFARSFRNVTGVTPREYVSGVRTRALKQGLRVSRGVDAAIYDAGYGSPSRVYERASDRLGMTPGQYRRGGAGVDISTVCVKTVLGDMMIGATDRGICFLQFGDSREALEAQLQREYPRARITQSSQPEPPLDAWVGAVDRYLKGEQPDLDLPLDIRATAFQLRVWKYLQGIPYGDLQSYAEVAKGIGEPGSARAVAQACGKNAVAIAIPCHRIVRGDGNLGGYRWGLHRKRVLIDLERAHRSAAQS
ncbi:MAG: methylated-DNA--[protein]-cysteine S-methyltransferase [Candidatus Eremiobacteraeota bacterium]|nr:methylated-DNA--[protein]-cysteine S-methyltransferase [Candidatus Eremiobacteraeota bacterium]